LPFGNGAGGALILPALVRKSASWKAAFQNMAKGGPTRLFTAYTAEGSGLLRPVKKTFVRSGFLVKFNFFKKEGLFNFLSCFKLQAFLN
jgi:hypothetical protein